MNKKIISLLSLVTFLLCGCNYTNFSEIKYEFYGKSDIMFTEFLTGNSPSDRAVEISNIGESKLSLSGYSIWIFKRMNKTPYIKIDLGEISLNPKESYTIASTKSSEELKAKADLVTEDMFCDGTWPLALAKDNKIVDTLGQIGYQTEYGKKKTIVRKEEFFVNREIFNSYDWITYQPNDFSHLGNCLAGISEEELLYGPKLTEEMQKLPFIEKVGDSFIGGGGFVEVTLGSLIDGDTTRFNFPSSLREFNVNSNESVRYLKINTPEIQHGTSIDAQPWGYYAKNYNNSILRNAKHYIVQTERNNTFRETYGRFLGYVWYSNKDNPSLSDYRCLNCEEIGLGLASCYFYDDNALNNPVLYKGVSYTNFFLNAEKYASNLGLKIHGEVDPDFNY